MIARLTALVLLLLPQARGGEDKCPWCKNDPKILAAAGWVGHGPLEFGKDGKKSDEIAKTLPGVPFRFLETQHLRIGSSLGKEVVTLEERPRVEAELDKLRPFLPTIPKKIQELDPWLRLHLMAMKCEELYSRFQKVMKVTDADFPEERTHGKPFMGNGRFLGEKDKYEITIHAVRTTHNLYTQDTTGARVTDALRWHLKTPHKMMVSIPAEDGDLRQDKFLYPHVAHNLAHLLFCGYKHFSWDPPVWFDEGLAHAFELEGIKDLNVTFCSDEGAGPDRERGKDWASAIVSLLDRKKAAPLAELMARKNFSELKKEDHITAWSKVRFLMDAHPDKFAQFAGDMKGRLDLDGNPTGKDLPGFTREKIKELWGWTPSEFDREWEAWVRKVKQ